MNFSNPFLKGQWSLSLLRSINHYPVYASMPSLIVSPHNHINILRTTVNKIKSQRPTPSPPLDCVVVLWIRDIYVIEWESFILRLGLLLLLPNSLPISTHKGIKLSTNSIDPSGMR